MEMEDLAIQKELVGGQERNRIYRAMRNGSWLSTVPHRLNSTELSQKEFRDNFFLRYRLMTQDTPVTCDGCGKRSSIKHAISFPKGILVLAQHDESAKEWVALGAWALVPSEISYKPKISSRIVQGERTGAGARQDSEAAKGGALIIG